jgi:hypothetical protein
VGQAHQGGKSRNANFCITKKAQARAQLNKQMADQLDISRYSENASYHAAAKEKAEARRSAAACSLLPCPFCRSADVGYYAFTCVIRCHYCGTEGPIDALRDQGRSVAAELWNRRAND